MKYLEIFNPFRQPSAEVMAVQELEDAKRQLLSAQSGLEYAKAMVAYRTEQIERLNKIVSQQNVGK